MSHVDSSTFDYQPWLLYFQNNFFTSLLKVLNFSLSYDTQIMSINLK